MGTILLENLMLRIIQKVVLCFSFFSLALAPNLLWACSIGCPEHPPKPPLPAEKFKKHSVIFLGMLVEKAELMQDEPCREKDDPLLNNPGTATWKKQMMECYDGLSPKVNDHRYTFEIEKAWKGTNGKTISLFEYIDNGPCAGQGCPTEYMVLDHYRRIFELGKHYLVYAHGSSSNGRLYPNWKETRPAELAQVEMMFLDAAAKNSSTSRLVEDLPQVFRNHSSTWAKAEAIKWLDQFPLQGTVEERKQFFLEALSHADKTFQQEKELSRRTKKFKDKWKSKFNADKLKSLFTFEEDDSYVLTAIALALGNKDFKGDEEIIQALIYLLKGEEPLVHVAAARSLKMLGFKDKKIDKRIYEVLKKGQNHSVVDVHNLALRTLVEIKTPESRIILLENRKENTTDDSSIKSYDKKIEKLKKALTKNKE